MVSAALNRIVSRVVTGDGLRKSRLHTYSGNRIDLAGLMYLPKSLWSVFLLKGFGYRQRVPWLGYRAVVRLRLLMQPTWNILEYGSGMSTLLFAASCHRMVSVESDAEWYKRTQSLLSSRGVTNVDYRLCRPDAYVSQSDLPDHSFDLVVVDGLSRDQVAVAAILKVKPGGYVFLDNSDVPWEEYTAARSTLLKAADKNGIWRFNDLYPFQMQVNESMLIRVPGVAT